MTNQAYRPIGIGPEDADTELHRAVGKRVSTLPVLRLTSPISTDSEGNVLAEIIAGPELDTVPVAEIITLAHFSSEQGLTKVIDCGEPNWADTLAVGKDSIYPITGCQNPALLSSLYIIRVHAPSWPEQSENFSSIRSGRSAGYECKLAFVVTVNQFAEITIRYDENLQRLLP